MNIGIPGVEDSIPTAGCEPPTKDKFICNNCQPYAQDKMDMAYNQGWNDAVQAMMSKTEQMIVESKKEKKLHAGTTNNE